MEGLKRTVLPPHLILWNNNLAALRILRLRDGRIKDTDASDYLANLFYLIQKVSRFSDHALTSSHFNLPVMINFNANGSPVLVIVHFLDWLPQYEGTTIHGRQTRKPLRQIS
jgi:hypothetical protein